MTTHRIVALLSVKARQMMLCGHSNRLNFFRVDRAAGHGVCSVMGHLVRLYGAVSFFLLLLTLSAASAAESVATGRQLLPPNSTVVVEVRQPQTVFQHPFVQRLIPILEQSRGYRAALGSPNLDLVRDSITHFETEFGIPLPQIIDSCAGDGIWASAAAENPPEFCIVVSGREPERLARMPDVTLKLIRRIVAGRSITLPEFEQRTYHQHQYHKLGDACYAVVGKYWLLANRDAGLHGMLDRLDGRQPPTATGLPPALPNATTAGAVVRVGADITKLKTQPNFDPLLKWPPKDLGQIILLGGWFDLAQRSQHVTAEVDFSGDALQGTVRFPATPANPTPGTVGFFASEPATSSAPLLEPAQCIYSASWYRDYWKMWEQRAAVPLQEEVQRLEMQLKSVETGNLGYSAFDILRLLGPHMRFVVTRPGLSPYRVPVSDRLPAFAIVFDIRDESEFRQKVLPPIQRILGIVAITQKMIAQNTQYKSAEVSAMKFPEDAASIANSNRVRYNFEPTYSLTRGHLVIGSTANIVRELIDELDRLQKQPVQQSLSEPGVTERQVVRFAELAGIVSDMHGLSVRNAVLNDGFTIEEATQELGVLQQLVSALGQLKVQAGFDPRGFEYRIQWAP